MRFFFAILLSLLPLQLFAGTPFVRAVDGGIELSNDLVTVVISESAELVSCSERGTGIDIAIHDKAKIASAKTKNGSIVQAERVVLDGSVLRVFFGDKSVNLFVNAFDNFFTIEVMNDLSYVYESITFVNMKFVYDFNADNPFLSSGVALSLQTDSVFYPSGESKQVQGRCAALSGMKGAKLAITFCRKKQLREILKSIYSSITTKAAPMTTMGGPFSLDCSMNQTDCLIIDDSDPSLVEDWVSFFSKLGIKQFNFHTGQKTFIQGQFSFPVVGSASAFNESVSTPLMRAGIVSALHTYAYYISYDATEILSNPKWQQQLEFREVFSLLSGLTSSSTEIRVSENTDRFKRDMGFWTAHSPFLLIDNEIVKYSFGQNGVLLCKRGQCGTRATSHKSGAKARLIGGRFSHIAPRPGSELFYEVAHRTAEAYNEGGFKGIYFDALDGLSAHLEYAGLEDYLWYYGASFISEVINNCIEPPLVEYSTLYPSLWAARGRGGAWDCPNRGYKNFVDDHIKNNNTLIDRHYVTTLGWFNFYPVNSKEPHNYSTKYLFFDDVDYLGTKAIAYNQTMVYNGLKASDVEEFPAMRRNLELYSKYTRFRTSGYFNDSVLSLLRRGEYEYKLAHKNGRWGFNEAQYIRCKISDIKNNQLVGFNPFKKQKPFIRLENQYSSDCTNTIPLLSFNDQEDFFRQTCEKRFDEPIDLSTHLGLLVSLKGNGIDSKDAICIRLTSTSPLSGFGDYVIRLNFEGWRDVILTSLDNAETPDLNFSGMEDWLYYVHRYNIDFSKVGSIKIYRDGKCEGVKIKQIKAIPLLPNAINNPGVNLGRSSLVFLDTIQSGEYIEYYVGEKNALVYDYLGNSRKISVSKNGRFRVPRGSFVADVSGNPDLNKAPAGVVLTIGLYGAFIHN